MWLEHQYWDKEQSLGKIATSCGVSRTIIRKRMKIFNIRRRTKSESKMGKLNPRWGKTWTNKTTRLPPGEASFNMMYRSYKAGAKRRNLEFSLTKEQFKNITSCHCYYCDAPPTYLYGRKELKNGKYPGNGVDRLDNAEGYVLGNCVACCITCNNAKRELSVPDFFEWIRRAYHVISGF